ncbi:hypothetical protein Cadr_000010688 [Camelus dromedarius]|uniref:Uncharacterized protein n=1 Tax=Camelus dromedarius TaxID=9838 RepID=A0A5N4DRF2_CAMDR|nr:hypothetical protein Cadr_000010688 [Camelus dromedarius]
MVPLVTGSISRRWKTRSQTLVRRSSRGHRQMTVGNGLHVQRPLQFQRTEWSCLPLAQSSWSTEPRQVRAMTQHAVCQEE